MKKRKETTIALVESAVMISLATVLSLIVVPFLTLPYGGSVTLCSMLPLVIIGYRRGIKWGIGASLVYSIVQMMLGMSTISAAFLPGEDQMILHKAILMLILDYILAYSVIGMSGGIPKNGSASKRLCIGALLGGLMRYAMHFLSGLILWGSYAEWFFTDQMNGKFGSRIVNHFDGTGLAAIYSLIYNGLYMIPEIMLTVIAAYFVGKIPQISVKNK